MEDIIQRTESWHKARRGKFTGSEIHKLMGESRSKSEFFSDTAKTYIYEKVIEMFSDAQKESYQTPAMQWGVDYEPLAKKWYSKFTGHKVDEIGFVELEGFEGVAGGSPDGLVAYQHIIEIKCPYSSANHIRNILCEPTDMKSQLKEYYWQMQFYMACLNIGHCDFISFDPRINADFGLHIKRIERNEPDINTMRDRISAAIEYRNAIINKINKDNEAKA